MTLVMCAHTTASTLAGIRPRCGTRRGITQDVSGEPDNGAINDLIDDPDQAKDTGGPSLSPMIGARAATVKVMPRDGNA